MVAGRGNIITVRRGASPLRACCVTRRNNAEAATQKRQSRGRDGAKLRKGFLFRPDFRLCPLRRKSRLFSPALLGPLARSLGLPLTTIIEKPRIGAALKLLVATLALPLARQAMQFGG